ncbi:HAD family hydrolase [Campylobacter sp. RM12637]|uniref:HAD family hydrolase n=1 Tax=Campylobacter sp. RM12637 TaxID=2735734 RepID=UPI003014D2E6|nr:HAD-IA family hydrolase [Campylobacter sp. RM12637]
MKYKLVIFDLDGTLVDSSIGILKAIEYTIVENKLPKLDDEIKASFIGPLVFDSFKRVYGYDDDLTNNITQYYRNVYKKYFLNDCKIYDGIIELLQYLKEQNCYISIATYKKDDHAKKLISDLNINSYFDYILGSDLESKMTKQDIIKANIALFNLTQRDCIMIGDSIHDAKGAMECGIDFIGVTYGFGFKDEKDLQSYPNKLCAKNPYKIIDFLKQ